MIQAGMIHYLQNRVDRARFRIFGSIHKTLQASVNCRSSAHGARFNCSKQLTGAETMVTDDSSRLAQCNDLCVCRRITVAEIAVPSSAYDTPVAYDHSADRHFVCLEGSLRAAKRLLHPKFVGRSALS